MKCQKTLTLLVWSMLCIPLANSRVTDSVILSTKFSSGGLGQTISLDSGVTIENGDVWIWGFRGSGQQGNGKSSVSNSAPPERVKYFVDNNINIVQVTAGAYHFIALDEFGDVWGWGQNLHGSTGADVCPRGIISSPCRVIQGQNIVTIGAGEYVSYALSADGDVYAWGHGIYGQRADGTRKAEGTLYKIPRSDFDGEAIALFGAAYEGGYAITESGKVYGWGDDQDNSFGYDNGNQDHIYRVKPIELANLAVDGSEISYICGGEGMTSYLTTSNEVYGMGQHFNLGSGLCRGKTANSVLIATDISSLYCRYSGSIAVSTDNSVWTWGFCSSAFDIYGSVPTKRIDGDRVNVTKIDGGKEHFYYWTDEGKGYGVGYGAGRKLDQNSSANVSFDKAKELTFLITEMKKVYGQDYLLGQ